MAQYQIVAIRMSGLLASHGHEHITDVKLSVGSAYTIPEIIDFIGAGHSFIVNDGRMTSLVAVVRISNPHRAYIRTHADGDWNNNLLALPPF